MDAENRKPESEDLNRWLDIALRERVNAEPRSGLEDRVLASLAARPQHRIVWWPAMAIAALILAIVIGVALFSPRHQQQVASQPPSPAASYDTKAGINKLPPDKELSPTKSRVNTAKESTCCSSTKTLVSKNHDEAVARPRVRVETAEILPMLATFPAPSPETAQEHMLARLMARRGSYELAKTSPEMVPLRDLSIPELKIEPMEGTPSDETPQE